MGALVLLSLPLRCFLVLALKPSASANLTSSLVLSGASGLGRATTDLIVARGGKVVIMDFNEDNGVAAAKAYGGKAVFHLTDVTDAKQVQAGIERPTSPH
jgi:NADP-dependent 3-hydroxy acid dehydrogenase YdfG